MWRGIVISNREERFTKSDSIPNRGEFLMQNPFKKDKKKKKKKGNDRSPLRRGGKSKSKSPTKTKTSQRASQDSLPSEQDDQDG